MKAMIHGFVSAIIAFVFLMAVTTIMGHMTRSKESSTSLSGMLSSSVESVMKRKNYSININTQDKFATDVLFTLIASYSNDADLSIEVIAADYEKGFLCLRLTEKHKNPNGGESTIIADKAVIFEKDERVVIHKLIYINNNNIYSSYDVEKGKSSIIINSPGNNKKWLDSEGKEYFPGTEILLNEDLILYAN